jgi:Fe-S oxidoreductase
MERSGKRTFCCGAGGAHMWMEERGDSINLERVREATETGADTLAVACPYCTVMLDDGVQSAGAEITVIDVATLLAQQIDGDVVRSAGDESAPISSPGAS